jgi:monoamine oxidase
MTRSHIDRRTFLAGGAAAASVAMAPKMVRAQNKHQVLVIGAGLSGLNAALTLEIGGANVQVIEGSKRVGGRVLSNRNVEGAPEFGGTSMGAGYARMVDTAKRLGVPLVDVTPIIPYFRARELVLDGRIVTKEEWPDHPRNPFPEAMKTMMPWAYFFSLMGSSTPLKSVDDWISPEYAHLDISVHQWMTEKGASEEMIDLGYNLNAGFGDNAHDISVLQLFFSSAFANIQRELGPKGVAGYTAANGNQSIPEAMGNALKNEIQFDKEVMGIESHADGAEVHCADGTTYRADQVVCSVPFSVLRNINVQPIFTGTQALAVQTLPAQLMTLIHLVPKRPFWEDDGLGAAMFTDTPAGIVLAERKGESPTDVTSLTAWARGPDAAYLDRLDEADARRLVVKSIEDARPSAKGQLEVAGYKSWYRDPFAAGDWSYWRPGQITAFAQGMARPHGRIHLCGEHTAVSNRGMEGAMESGERAALEIFAKL